MPINWLGWGVAIAALVVLGGRALAEGPGARPPTVLESVYTVPEGFELIPAEDGSLYLVCVRGRLRARFGEGPYVNGGGYGGGYAPGPATYAPTWSAPGYGGYGGPAVQLRFDERGRLLPCRRTTFDLSIGGYGGPAPFTGGYGVPYQVPRGPGPGGY